jgi:hypothetical protein
MKKASTKAMEIVVKEQGWLSQYVARAGAASRRDATALIKEVCFVF